MATTPVLEHASTLAFHEVLEDLALPSSFWQTLGTCKKKPTATLIKTLLSAHNVDSPAEKIVTGLVAYATQLQKAKETESALPAQHETPTQFELNHIYKMEAPKAIQPDDDESLHSDDSSQGSTTAMENELFFVYSTTGQTAKIFWFYTREQIEEHLNERALREPRGPDRIRYVQMSDEPFVFALSDHVQSLNIDACSNLVDVTNKTAWSQQENQTLKTHEFVVTHYQITSPTVEPIRPIESCDLFQQRVKALRIRESLTKLLLTLSGNASNATTAFHAALNAESFDPTVSTRSYYACMFVQNHKKRVSHPKPKYIVKGGVAGSWANAVIKLCRYATRNVPWASSKAMEELELWAEALSANAKSASIMHGNSELVNLDTTDFGPPLFKHFIF